MIKLFCWLFIICGSLNVQPQAGHLIKTQYNFSVTFPENWKLLSKAEIEKKKEEGGSKNLIMPAVGYLGNKKDFDNVPHIYVVFHHQSKISEAGFTKSCNIILSDAVRGQVQKELSKKYPEWSFSAKKDEYYLDADRRLLMFTTNTKYSDSSSTVVLYCYFLMETGMAEVNFSFPSETVNDYVDIINEVLDTVEIDPLYKLIKD